MSDTLLMANKAGVMAAPCLVALCAVIHLHTIPGVLLVACDVPAPDIPTVLGEAITLVGSHVVRVPNGSMTSFAFHLCYLDMGCMREKDTLRLPGIDEPRNLLARLNIFLDKLFFFRMLTHLLFVALEAVFQPRDP